jgi:membrane protein DedA with SNARE-associated domain/rhodanese-related sulfurtransferase
MSSDLNTLLVHGPLWMGLLVFAKQLAIPLPVFPLLMVGGAAAVGGQVSASALFLAATIGSVLADTLWFAIGRHWGYRALRVLCKLSLSPDSCVRQTEVTLSRWGSASLIAGKFLPGFATVAAPVAGALGMSSLRFLSANTLGAAAYAGAGLGLGALFGDQIDAVLKLLAEHGLTVLKAFLILMAVFIAWRLLQRQLFIRRIGMARVTPTEVYRRLNEEGGLLIADVRTEAGRTADPRKIPGAIVMDPAHVDDTLKDLPKDRDIVLYCNCPNDASAAKVAKLLIDRGFKQVRPLAGGLDGWGAAGFEFERF